MAKSNITKTVLPLHILYFDFETTGLDVETEYIIQACFTDHNTSNTFSAYILPPPEVKTIGASHIHGITMEKLKSHECGALTFPEFYMRFSKWYYELYNDDRPTYWIAHNCWGFDMLIWESTLKRFDLPPLQNTCYNDTCLIFKDALPNLPSYRLGDIYHHIFNKPIENAHNANADVSAMKSIMDCLLSSKFASVNIKRHVHHTHSTISSYTSNFEINLLDRLLNNSLTPLKTSEYHTNITKFAVWELMSAGERSETFNNLNEGRIFYLSDLYAMYLYGSYTGKSIKPNTTREEWFKQYMFRMLTNRRIINIVTNQFKIKAMIRDE